MLRCVLLAISLCLQPSLFGADVDKNGYEDILIPIAFTDGNGTVPGAYGSAWGGQMWVQNTSTAVVNVQNAFTGCQGCTLPVGPRYVGFTPFGTETPQFGLLLSPRADEASALTFSVRIFETSRRGQPRGIDIPVVREGEFFKSTATFLGVPVDRGVRTSLRIYDPRASRDSRGLFPTREFRVDVLTTTGTQISTFSVRTAVPNPDTLPGLLMPGFVLIGDLVAERPELQNHDGVTLRVTPVDAGADFWAMVSTTDNDTQTVGIITAQ